MDTSNGLVLKNVTQPRRLYTVRNRDGMWTLCDECTGRELPLFPAPEGADPHLELYGVIANLFERVLRLEAAAKEGSVP